MALVTLNTVQRQGVFQTGSIVVPLVLPYEQVRITAQIPTADYEDVANSLRLSIYRFDTLSSTWKLVAGASWSGGRLDHPDLGLNPLPHFRFDVDDLLGQQIRGELDVPVRMRVGCIVEGLLRSER